MTQSVPIVTEIGTLRGRDAIFLDKLTVSEGCNTLTLFGEFNCHLASKRPKGSWQAYRIRFRGVLAYQMIELEAWSVLQTGKISKHSSFDEVINSPWLARMGSEVSPDHRHFLFQTYDYLFDIICKTYELQLKDTRD